MFSDCSDSSEPNPVLSVQPQHEEECLGAIRGEKIPSQLDHEGTRACVVRGIRLHYVFATSAAISTLCAATVSSIPQFTRARNARLIMSDVIPDGLDAPKLQPYCIWYPDFAKEDTYRELARVYPAMRYHVGRACAAAGYAELYAELDLLPDVSMAEEARESKNNGSRAIFDSIMVAPFKYAVMDDYKCTVNITDPPMPAFLNADTLVRSQLDVRYPVMLSDYDRTTMYKWLWTIEEDLKFDILDENHKRPDTSYITPEESRLLYQPLPLDLPFMAKKRLINMAAYEGNVDRYSRLRTPFMDETEYACVLRGIRHHTMFARWWATEILRDKPFIQQGFGILSVVPYIRSTINARRIMNNDIIGFEKEEELPWMIWWPLRPRPETLLSLAKICPRMKEEVAIACIYCDYQKEYDILKPDPTTNLRYAAEVSSNTHYTFDLKERTTDEYYMSGPMSRTAREVYSPKYDMEPTSNMLRCYIYDVVDIVEDFTTDEDSVLASEIERHVWASRKLLHKVEINAGRWCRGGEILDLERTSTPEAESTWGP